MPKGREQAFCHGKGGLLQVDDVQRVLVRQAPGVGEHDVVWGIVEGDGLQGADDRRSISTGVVGVWLGGSRLYRCPVVCTEI